METKVLKKYYIKEAIKILRECKHIQHKNTYFIYIHEHYVLGTLRTK